MTQTPRATRNPSRSKTRGSIARSPWRLPLLAGLALAAIVILGGPLRAVSEDDEGHPGNMPMTEEAMKAHAEAYWSTHDPVGASPEAIEGAPAATFTVDNFFFDTGSPAAVDTAKILVGESVEWVWSAGFHTVTNGQDSIDPNAGALFDQPIDSGHLSFTFQFNSTGTFPFFCRFHELQDMRGVVVVSTPTGVGSPPIANALGFTRDPAPNPTRSGMSFQYALRTPGHASAEVFDAGGRRVAVLVNRVLPAGSYTASWDGRTAAGLADMGVYFVRLRLPGYEESRPVVLRR